MKRPLTAIAFCCVSLLILAGCQIKEDGEQPNHDEPALLFTSYAVPSVRAIAIDSKGGKWIGTENGLFFLDDNNTPKDKTDDTWTTFTTIDGLANNWIRALAIDMSGAKWIGTYGGGLSYIDDNGTPTDQNDDTWVTFTESDGLDYDYIMSVAIDAAGGKWIGTGNYMSFLDDKGTPTNKADDTWTNFTKLDGLADQLVYSIDFDTSGKKWIGNIGGANFFDDNGTPTSKADDTWTTFSTADGLAGPVVGDIGIDSSNAKWIGTQDGITYLDDHGTPANKTDDTVIVFTMADGLTYDEPSWSVVIDLAGNKWLGTVFSSDVCCLNDNGTPTNKTDDIWTIYTPSDGLSGGAIRSIVIDSSGGKWIGSASGISYCP